MLVTDATFAAECERVARATDVTLDIETDGLEPWKGTRVVGIAVEVDGRAAYFPERHEGGGNLPAGSLGKLLGALRGKREYRGWNLRFDLTTLSYEEGGAWCLARDLPMRDGIVDALLMHENEPSFALVSISEKYLGAGAAGEKGAMDRLLAERFPTIRSARMRKGNLWRLPAADVVPYACADVLLPLRLRKVYAPAIDRWGMTALAAEMNAYSLLLARMQVAGIPIDFDRCRILSAGTRVRQAGLLAAIREAAGPAFNPSSWQQVVRLCGTPDAREKTLARSGHPLAGKIVDYKKLGKAKAAYYDAILELVDPLGILHPQLNLTRDPSDVGGTGSGRLSCSHPNFQALPRANEDPAAIYQVRDLVVPPPGMKLAKLDYERAEMWLAGHYSEDEALDEAYHAGRDLYAELAKKTGTDRQGAKIDWLAIQYGARGRKLSEMHGWPFKSVARLERELGRAVEAWGDPEWRAYKSQKGPRVVDEFFELCPGIKRAMAELEKIGERDGHIRLWTGRVIHCDGVNTPAFTMWNRLIQGGVGEQIRTAMQRVEPELDRLGARMLLQVHDEVVLLYPEGAEREVIRVAKAAMEDFPQFRLRPRVEPKVSAINYAKMVPYVE